MPNYGNYVAIVTGARVKLGYEIIPKQLQSGAKVVAAMRFPKDAAIRKRVLKCGSIGCNCTAWTDFREPWVIDWTLDISMINAI